MFLQEMPEHTVTDAGKHVPSNPDQYHPSPLTNDCGAPTGTAHQFALVAQQLAAALALIDRYHQ
jgi:hypothetical protein